MSVKKGLVLVMFFILGCSQLRAQIQNSLPNNHDTILDNEPTLIWQCLTSYIGNPRYSMTLTVSEMQEDQTALEAITENVPSLYRENLAQNSFSITTSEVSLQEGVWYAWQITLLYDGVPVQQSEAWQFIIYVPVPEVRTAIPLKIVSDGTIYSLEDDILMVSAKELNEVNLSAFLRNEQGVLIPVTLIEVVEGEEVSTTVVDVAETRMFNLHMDSYNCSQGIYTLNWTPTDGTTYVLVFDYQ